MELLLNLVWVVIALVVLSAFGLQRKQRSRSARARMTGLVAVVTVLILVFPVISIDDDFHPVIGSLEDSTKRILQTPVSFDHSQDAPAIAFLAAVLLLQSLPTPGKAARPARSDHDCRFLECARMPRDGRSPPVF